MTKRNKVEEAFSEGFYDLPGEQERADMTVLQLAELLSTRQVGTPAYIVLEHELNLKIAKVQAKATLSSGWLGFAGSIIAALFAFALGYYFGQLPTSQEPSSVDVSVEDHPSTQQPELITPSKASPASAKPDQNDHAKVRDKARDTTEPNELP